MCTYVGKAWWVEALVTSHFLHFMHLLPGTVYSELRFELFSSVSLPTFREMKHFCRSHVRSPHCFKMI